MVHNDIIRRTKNMMRSPIFPIAIALSILIGVIQTPDRGWVGRLYTFQAGQPYMFQEPINLEFSTCFFVDSNWKMYGGGFAICSFYATKIH